MSTATYQKFELLRAVRNRQALVFTVFFPIVMFFLLAGPNKDNHNFGGDSKHHTGLFAPQYYMVGLLAFGTMIAVLSTGARIAAERTIGWNRQLRLTPLSARGYLRSKVVTGYLLALISVVLLFSAGISLGVRLPLGTWLHMTALVLIALIPFAALGIAMGHVLNDDAAGAALGVGGSLFAFLGGTWFPITGGGLFVDFCQLLPSYWLVQAGHVGLGQSGDPWGVKGWLVLAVWSAVAAALAMWAYQRDTRRA
ncbi:MAG TPA: ABC transporter permease [Jatrophihabitans sp.]|jgi:ABC-2 type transport system permease protein|uniref:ABC transporter permease n=1 Tax=Jatrophihabitans sp. TaxID=1932789 RepID=UPI002E0333A5|nr:ABC transporter permease [Jatrophihabitans sp.]